MTTPDLEALARELEERACALDKDARDWRKHNPPVGSFSDLRAGDREASAIAHRQAAALIRAKAPGRRDIARLIWPVAFGKRTDGLTLDQVSDMQIDALTKADAILALFHAQPPSLTFSDEQATKLADHWLHEMRCDHDAKTDVACCSCGWVSEAKASIGEAAKAWASHALSTLEPK